MLGFHHLRYKEFVNVKFRTHQHNRLQHSVLLPRFSSFLVGHQFVQENYCLQLTVTDLTKIQLQNISCKHASGIRWTPSLESKPYRLFCFFLQKFETQLPVTPINFPGKKKLKCLKNLPQIFRNVFQQFSHQTCFIRNFVRFHPVELRVFPCLTRFIHTYGGLGISTNLPT